LKKRTVRGIKSAAKAPRNLILRATNRALKPRWLVFEVTDRCNSRCQHCDIWSREPTRDALTTQEIEKALSDPLFGQIEYILNTGGEPFLRRDLEEVILIEHKVLPEARIQLSTNGLLPKRVIHVVKSALRHDINIEVGVSLDGIGEKHDLIRGVKGNFEKVDWLLHELSALRENHQDKLHIEAGMVLSDLTLHSLEEIRRYVAKFNIEPVVAWYNEAPFYNNIGRNLSINNEELSRAVQSLSPSLVYDLWLKALKGKSMKFPCFAMYTFCLLRCNGDVVPCLSFSDVKAGNVRESSPTLIWHSPESKKTRTMVKDCQGCLNSWGVNWSFASSFYAYLLFFLRHPHALIRWVRDK